MPRVPTKKAGAAKPKAKSKPKVKPARKPAAKVSARVPAAAAAAASGAKTSEIAELLGVSRTTAWRILNTEEVQQMAVTFANDHVAALKSLFRDGLVAISEALRADRPDTITKDGTCFPGGPDHYARLAAVAKLLNVLTAGRPKPKPADPGQRKGMTLSELEEHVSRGSSAPSK